MKFVCTQENLAHGLHIVARAASKNIALPILNNVLLIAEHGVVRLLTTNLEVAVTTQIRAKVETEGRYTANSRLLSEYIAALKNEKLTLETTADGLIVRGEHTDTVVKGLPADEFPVLPTVEALTEITIPTTVFQTALQEVLFAAANDEARPEISGVYFRLDKDALILAATDSYRLSERRVTSLTSNNSGGRAILPARACQEILRVLDVDAESATFRFDERQSILLSGDTEIVTRLIEGQYPDYQQLIPEKHETTARVAKDEFAHAIKAASLFSQPGINDLTLHFTATGEIQFASASSQAGRHAASVRADIQGPEKEIVFNYRYLLDGVQSLPGEEILIELGDPQSPGVLRSPKSKEAVYLIMPIRQ